MIWVLIVLYASGPVDKLNFVDRPEETGKQQCEIAAQQLKRSGFNAWCEQRY